MIKKKKKRDLAGIPTASMSDVAFLLLVFFLTTTKFDIKKGLNLMLPEPNKDAGEDFVLDDANLTRVKINAKGKIALNYNDEDIPVDFNQLEKRIRDIVNNNKDMVFQLKADRESNYEYMIKVLDALQLAGAEKISLATK